MQNYLIHFIITVFVKHLEIVFIIFFVRLNNKKISVDYLQLR